MNQRQILEELVSLLETNGIQVRDEPMPGQRSGLCTVRGRPIMFLDSDTSVQDSADACAEAAGQAINIEELYIKPQVRQYIEAHRNSPE
ncbi:MAG: hypothetical protein GY809_04320 [Planctomycetes bacterium]|nr:hypothetical protein [Planctomycetota bacterium]